MEETRGKDVGYDIADSNLTPDSMRFYTFLRDELIPYVEANYRTSPFLTLVGEGITGNFITHYLKESVPIFNAYISLNPSLAPNITSQIQSFDLERMGWNGQYVLLLHVWQSSCECKKTWKDSKFWEVYEIYRNRKF